MPCRSSGGDLTPPLPRDQVQSLVEEARSWQSLLVWPKNLREKLLSTFFTKSFPLPILATSHLCRGSTLNIVACIPIPSLTLWKHPRFFMTLFSSKNSISRNPNTKHSGWPIPNQVRFHSQVEIYSLWLRGNDFSPWLCVFLLTNPCHMNGLIWSSSP